MVSSNRTDTYQSNLFDFQVNVGFSRKTSVVFEVNHFAYDDLCNIVPKYDYDAIHYKYLQEKKQNNFKSLFMEQEFKTTFVEKIKSSDFEYGFLSNADEYLDMFREKYEYPYVEWIYDLYRENADDEAFIVGLLKILAHIPGNKIDSKFRYIVQECLENEYVDIKEHAVRACENLEYTGAICFLEKIHFTDPFLEDYLQGVIQDLKELKNGFDDQKT